MLFRLKERERRWGRKRREAKSSVSQGGKLENSIDYEMEVIEECSVSAFTSTHQLWARLASLEVETLTCLDSLKGSATAPYF